MSEVLSLTQRITVAFCQMRLARDEGDYEREWSWQGMTDRLLDRHIVLLKAAGKFVPLTVLDPALSTQLTCQPVIRLVGSRESRATTPMG